MMRKRILNRESLCRGTDGGLVFIFAVREDLALSSDVGGARILEGMRDFLLFMVDQAVFGADEVGFGRITCSAERLWTLSFRSMPDALKKQLQPIKHGPRPRSKP